MGTVLTFLAALLVVAGIPVAIGFHGAKKAQAMREAAAQKRAVRRDSSKSLPAVKKSRLATPVGVKR